MLPISYKFKVRNDAGVDATVDVYWQPYRLGADLVPTYQAQAQPAAAEAVVAGTSYLSAAIDNGSPKNHGGHAILSATIAGAPSGDAAVRLYFVGGDGTRFGDEERLLGTLVFTAAGTLAGTFEVPFG